MVGATTTKARKRTAPTQPGPKPKKLILERDNRPVPADTRDKKRTQPVTRNVDIEEDEEDKWEEEEDKDEDEAFDNEDNISAERTESKMAKDPNGVCISFINAIHILQKYSSYTRVTQSAERAPPPASSSEAPFVLARGRKTRMGSCATEGNYFCRASKACHRSYVCHQG